MDEDTCLELISGAGTYISKLKICFPYMFSNTCLKFAVSTNILASKCKS